MEQQSKYAQGKEHKASFTELKEITTLSQQFNIYKIPGVMLIVGCTSQDGRPAKSARRSDREDEDMTHAYL
jgi:hypothetical protein